METRYLVFLGVVFVIFAFALYGSLKNNKALAEERKRKEQERTDAP